MTDVEKIEKKANTDQTASIALRKIPSPKKAKKEKTQKTVRRPVKTNPGIHNFRIDNVERHQNGNVITDSLMDEIARSLGGRAGGLTKGTAESWGFNSASDAFCWFKEEVEEAPENPAYASAIANWIGINSNDLWPVDQQKFKRIVDAARCKQKVCNHLKGLPNDQ